MQAGGFIVGLLVIALGMFLIAFGDKKIGKRNSKVGIVEYFVSGRYLNPKIRALNLVMLKWAIGILVIGFGLAILINRENF
jgi:hypothetical protein